MFFGKKATYRVQICVKGNCAEPEAGFALEKRLLALIESHGLNDSKHPQYTTCRVVNCLGVCHSGPVMLIHPGAIRYGFVDEAKLERIFQEHILQNTPPQDLILPYPQSKAV